MPRAPHHFYPQLLGHSGPGTYKPSADTIGDSDNEVVLARAGSGGRVGPLRLMPACRTGSKENR